MRVRISECCDSIPWNDTDTCAECRKKADFYYDFWHDNIPLDDKEPKQ